MAERAQKKSRKPNELSKVNKEIEKIVQEWSKLRGGIPCYSLLIDYRSIDASLVDDVFEELRENYSETDGRLDVLVHSGGGDIDAAYNLSQLFRCYGSKHLEYIVPRWAKSAATMLVCSGDRILMTPVSELGPLDPQITEMNVLEGRLEQFSPLHIDATMNLIREEYKQGNQQLAAGLLERLQFPLTLGKYKSAINIASEYMKSLLSSRMLKDDAGKIEVIANKLTTGYTDHGVCIGIVEVKGLGLVVDQLTKEQTDVAWKAYRLAEKRNKLIIENRKEKAKEELKDLPPEILKRIPDMLGEK